MLFFGRPGWVRCAAHVIFFATVLGSFVTVAPSQAASVTLAWDKSPDQSVSSYFIYYGAQPRTYTNKMAAGSALTLTVDRLAPGATYYFAATAQNDLGMESDYSVEVSALIPTANQRPIALPLTISAAEDQPMSLTLQGSDPDNDPISYEIVSAPANGTLAGVAPSLTYRPAANYFGQDSFTYRTRDGKTNSPIATVSIGVTPVNDAPTLNPINNISINANAGQQTIALSGVSSGAANEADVLKVTAVSSNPGLIPQPVVTYSSPSSTGSLALTPASNAYGSAVVSVTIDDGQTQSSAITRMFTVLVNGAPTISSIPNQNAVSGETTPPIPFTISDPETPASALIISAVSSAPALLPNSAINLAGTDGQRSIALTPIPGATGSATITLTVSDGQSSSTTAFAVAIQSPSPNSAPLISQIPDQIIGKNTAAEPVLFKVSDPETAPDNLIVSATTSDPAIISPTNIVFGGAGTDRTVQVRHTGAKTGKAIVDVIVSDGKATSLSSFVVTVSTTTSKITIRKTGKGAVSQTVIGTSYTVTAIADPGYVFAGWTGALTSSKPQLTFATKSNLVLEASFTPLTVTIHGGGSISPNLARMSNLSAGKTYTITAVPGNSYEFTNWSGSVASSAKTLTFTMQPNMTIEVNFVPSPFTPVAGRYTGLFYESDQVSPTGSGGLSLVLGKRGSFTGTLRTEGASHPFSSKFALDGKATRTIARAGKTPLTLTLQLGTAENDQLTGSVTDGTWIAGVLADRVTFQSATNPAPYAGRYTLVLPGSPDIMGYGYGVTSISSNGLASTSGRLADGSLYTHTSYISRKGHWPVYVPVSSGKGALLAWLNFEDRSGDDLHGTVSWIRPASKSVRYSAGFTNDFEAIGSRYTRPIGSTNQVLTAITEAGVLFSGGDLPQSFLNTITIGRFSTVTNLGPNRMSLTFNRLNGQFTGTVALPESKATRPFRGVVFQKQNMGFGLMLGTNLTSTVELIR